MEDNMKRYITKAAIAAAAAAAFAAGACGVLGGVALAGDNGFGGGDGITAHAYCGAATANPVGASDDASQCNAPVIIIGPGARVGRASNGGGSGDGTVGDK